MLGSANHIGEFLWQAEEIKRTGPPATSSSNIRPQTWTSVITETGLYKNLICLHDIGFRLAEALCNLHSHPPQHHRGGTHASLVFSCNT